MASNPIKRRLAKTKITSKPRLRLIEKLSLEDLRRKVQYYRDSYYNGESIISDEEFDAVEKRLKELSPNDPLLEAIGSKPVVGKKVILPIPMGSLTKLRAAEAVKWLDNVDGSVVLTDKLDGVSILVFNKNGHTRIYTRGNGRQGQDITHMLPQIAGIGNLRANESVRGELIMPKSNFSSSWASKFVNARNLVSGLVNSKSPDRSIMKDVLFVAHEMIAPQRTINKAATYLKSRGFNVVDYVVFQNPSLKKLQQYLQLRRQRSPYEIDGLVCTSVDTNETVAFKEESEIKEATVKTIEWTLSRHKIFKPVIILQSGVSLSGATVKRVTGHNARYIVENKIGPGAIIKVTRSGEVIPKVIGVVKGAKPNFPKNYDWDDNHVDITGDPENRSDENELVAKRLSEALRVLEVPNTREKQLAKLANYGITTLLELFQSSDKDFAEAGLGPIQADQLFTSLKIALTKIDHSTMMKASGFWPRGYGVRRFDLVLAQLPYKDLINFTDAKLTKLISVIPGMTVASAKEFIKHLPRYDAFVRALKWKPIKINRNNNDPLASEVIVFSGFRNRNVENIIKARGGKVAAGITKATTILVTTTPKSVKSLKAKALRIRIMPPDKFSQLYGITL